MSAAQNSDELLGVCYELNPFVLVITMDNVIAFETGPYAVTQEVWAAAFKYLELQNKTGGPFQISRNGSNQVQITTPKGEIISRFVGKNVKDKKVWSEIKKD